MKRLLPCLLLLALCLPCRAATVTYQNCRHAAQFAAFVRTIRPEYLNATQTHWVVVEYPASKWALACRIYGATGNPKAFTGVSFLVTHIVLVEDGGDALGTFIHECGHIIFFPALADGTFPEFLASLDALYQHEYDVLGRDSLHSGADVEEAWCEELRHSQTPGDTTVTAWGKSYFPQLFSQTGPVPPLMPVPSYYDPPPGDDVPPMKTDAVAGG